jgi:lysylphosphatidylglycerol synthetase-like protein (DUF2156 family)
LSGATPTDAEQTTLQRVADYFSTLKGIASAAPTLLTLADAAEGWLPISTILKPWVYVLIVLMTLFAVWTELSRFAGSVPTKTMEESMRRRAALHFFIGLALLGAYWIAGNVLNDSMPQQTLARTAVLYGLALLIGGVFAEISRAFSILALATN